MIAKVIDKPSTTLEPRPSSSMMTRAGVVALLSVDERFRRMYAISVISALNVELKRSPASGVILVYNDL